MGTFEGHVIPSVIYSFLALWWGFVTSVKYARTVKNKKSTFLASATMPGFCCPNKRLRQFPYESFVKLTFLSVHSFVEIYTGLYRTGDDGRLHLGHENLHHVCMLSGFLLGSIIEILIYYGVPFPERAECMFNILAFMIQALIMTVHLHGDEGLEHMVHTLWTVLIVLTFLASLVEVSLPNNYWPAIVRISLFFTQGTWLMQIAFVVWPKTKNPYFLWTNDHDSMVWLTVSLMYHLLGCFTVLMIQYLLVLKTIGCLDRYYSRYESDLQEAVEKIKYEQKQMSFDDGKEYAMLMQEDDENLL